MPRNWRLQAEQSANDRKWYVTLRGGNGETVLRSKGYVRLDEAKELARLLKVNEIIVLPKDDIGELLGAWTLQPRKGTDGQWYNRLTAPSGDKMWSEGYPRIDSAKRACKRMGNAQVVIVDPVPYP